MRFAQVPVGPMANLSYVFGDARTGEGAVVDPGFERDKLRREAERLGLRVAWVFLTHGHFDHVQEAEALAEETGARLAAHPLNPVEPDVPLVDGAIVRVGDVEVRAVETPGHARDAVCLVAGGKVFTGDTLFVGECGRVDLPGSDAEAMWNTLMHVLAALPRDLVVCPGHDYGATPTSTLEREFRENPTLRPRSLEAFVAFMREP